ncbi:MAG: hypothetical protein RQ715_07700 [Methylococcales bacterium]|nr:hypothetical protein [Methylococcales bacterium]
MMQRTQALITFEEIVMRIFWIALLGLVFTIAEGSAVPVIPEPLKPWVDWVLAEQPDAACPFLNSNWADKHCVWPGQLNLDLTAKGGTWSLEVHSFKDNHPLQLPGDKTWWPQSVKLDGQPWPVLSQHQRPVLYAPPGKHRITGTLLWQRLPDALLLPEHHGLLRLRLAGADVTEPIIKQGRLWLGTRPNTQPSDQDRLRLQVFRRVLQGIPNQLETRLQLSVGGSTRLLSLTGILPEGATVQTVQSPLPTRWRQDNATLAIELKPGQWPVTVNARLNGPLTAVPAPNLAQAFWPDSELWAYQADAALPALTVTGVPSIDPSQTALPKAWHSLPAYQVRPGDTLTFRPRLGQRQPTQQQLRLQRDLWLDFSGPGMTIVDHIDGVVDTPSRLHVWPELALGRVLINGQPRLLTFSERDEPGVALRKPDVSLTAHARATGIDAPLPVSGWQTALDTVRWTVHLPPGWQLLAATGVDHAPSTWLARWTLLEVFLWLVSVLAVAKLWRPGVAVLAGVTWLLVWQDNTALADIWLLWLAVAALLKVLPSGRLYQSVRLGFGMCSAALLALLVPLLYQLALTGWYPQLTPITFATPVTADAAPMTLQAEASRAMPRTLVRSKSVAAFVPETQDLALELDPNAKVQTGPGIPEWRGQQHHLRWQGRVTPEQTFRLWLLTPIQTRLLKTLTFILLLLTGWRLAGGMRPWLRGPAASLALVFVLLGSFSPMHSAWADFPERDLLKDLQQRLTQPPDCLPQCVTISHMTGAVDAKQLDLQLEIAVGSAVAVPLPVDGVRFPQTVTVNGQQSAALTRVKETLYLALPPGVHQVRLTGSVAGLDNLTLAWPIAPRYSEFSSQGWKVSGLNTQGQIQDALRLTRQRNAAAPTSEWAASDIAPFARLHRTLILDQDTWMLHTDITRVSSNPQALMLRWPLLPGESVLDAQAVIDQHQVAVTLPSGVTHLSIRSTLNPRSTLVLTAADNMPYTERWQVNVAPMWHLEHQGIKPIYRTTQQTASLAWWPWPGQQLTLTITRPRPVPGETLTVQASQWHIEPGARQLNERLNLTLISAIGQNYRFTLPEQAVLENLNLDGQRQPPAVDGRILSLTLPPGEHRLELDWQRPGSLTTAFTPLPPDLGLMGHNSRITLNVSPERWLLWTQGPRLGPSVLFWPLLVVLIAGAVALRTLKAWPLSMAGGVALLAGLSQLPLAAVGVVVGWFMLLAWRERHTPGRRWTFNVMQILIVLLTGLFLSVLLAGVEQGLLGQPNMQIAGNNASASVLEWYQDRHGNTLPDVTVITAPIWLYRGLMLVWSLWLALRLVAWLRWGFTVFSRDGLWRGQVVT